MSFTGTLVYRSGLLRPDLSVSSIDETGHWGHTCHVYVPDGDKDLKADSTIFVCQYEHGLLLRTYAADTNFRLHDKTPSWLLKVGTRAVRCKSEH